MKKVAAIVAAFAFAASVAFAGYTYGQCQATAKSTGKQCKRGVSAPGDKYCYQHKK